MKDSLADWEGEKKGHSDDSKIIGKAFPEGLGNEERIRGQFKCLNVSKGVVDSLYVYAYKNDPVVSV